MEERTRAQMCTIWRKEDKREESGEKREEKEKRKKGEAEEDGVTEWS
jgi:hypothetical protein